MSKERVYDVIGNNINLNITYARFNKIIACIFGFQNDAQVIFDNWEFLCFSLSGVKSQAYFSLPLSQVWNWHSK